MPKRLTPAGHAAPPVEPIITGATLPVKEAAPKARTPRRVDTGAMYVRNIHHIPVMVRLSERNDKREIKLEPRGQREDLDIVSAEEQEDPRFLANLDVLFELVEVDVAKEIIVKQRTNRRKTSNTPWDYLKNSKGQAYDNHSVTVEEAFERQGITIGSVTTPAPDGSSNALDTGEIVRHQQPPQVSVPGSPGHPATNYMLNQPSYVDPEEYNEFLMWKQFKAEKARRDG